MKSYQDIVEAMSMKDLKKIPGGTEAQRKVAQDRQKAREAKEKGFGSKPKPSAVNSDTEPEKGGAIVNRKPELRKSQLGKWSQGIKNAPKQKDASALAKTGNSSALAKTGETAAEKLQKQKDSSGPAGKPKRDTTYSSKAKVSPKKEDPKDDTEKKDGNFLTKAIKKAGRATLDAARETTSTSSGVSQSGDLAGLSQRSKGVLS